MATKGEVIDNLEQLLTGLIQWEVLNAKYKAALESRNKFIRETEKQIKKSNMKYGKERIIAVLAILFLAGYLIMIFPHVVKEPIILIYVLVREWKYIVIICLIPFICAFYRKRESKEAAKMAETYSMKAQEIERDVHEMQINLEQVASFCQSYMSGFPGEYCKDRYAIERIIFFLKSGRVDTIKEAIDKYEEECYRNEMLNEQKKQTQYAQLSAQAKMQQAAYSQRMADSMEQIKHDNRRRTDAAQRTAAASESSAASNAKRADYAKQAADAAKRAEYNTRR